MIRLLIISICMLMLACNPSEPQRQAKTTEAPPLAENILAQSLKVHPFSEPAKPDTFEIKLVGDTVQTASVTFEIRNSKGEQIYEEKFKAIDLINQDLPANASPSGWDKFILNRIDTFFDEENFATPAIRKGMEFDPYYANKTAWYDIKSDSNRVGFYYLLGKEDGRWIAYSKALQKVVLYFNCC